MTTHPSRGPVADPGLVEAALESIGDGLLILDDQWRVRYLNRMGERFLERRRELLLGRDIWEEFAPAVGGPSYQGYHEARATGLPVQFEEFYAPLGKWFDVRAFPLERYLVVHFRDITSDRAVLEDLRQREADLSHAQAQAHIGSWRRDLVSGERVWSAEMKRVFGHPPEGPTPPMEAFLEALVAEDRPMVEEGLAQAARVGTPWAGQVRVRLPDGGLRWVLGRVEAERNAAGEIVAIYGTAQDVTEYRNALDALASVNTRFQRQHAALLALTQRQVLLAADLQTALEEVAEGVAQALEVERVSVWRFTPGREAIRCDALYTRSGGRQARGAVLEETAFPAYFRAIRTSDVVDASDARSDPRTAEFCDPYLGPRGITSMLDAPVRLGGVIHGVISAEHTGPPRRWTADEQTFVIAAANLLSLVLAQAERREVEKRLQRQASLLDQAQDAILVRDLQHRVLYWSRGAERMYGWRAEEILGRSLADRLYDDPAVFHQVMQELLARGEWAGELQHRTASGATITVLARWALVRDQSGDPEAVLVINSDITERKHLEQRFFRTQRLESIGTLAGGIAHDLNNVLAPILMSIDLLRAGEDDPARLETLQTIEASARRGADMVRQVLSFARGVGGQRAEVRVDQLVRDVARIVDETFLKSIVVTVSVADDLLPVVGDATQLHQVLLNLAVNARDAMPNGGTLALEAANVHLDRLPLDGDAGRGGGRFVRLSVTDTGIGMPEGVQNRLFEPFFTTKEPGKGTGLGLPTSRAIVTSHGGFIEVESEPGQGSTFAVYLPAATEGAGEESAPARATVARGRGELVLVVDDEPAIRQVVQKALVAGGYRVVVAADGTEAAERLAEHRGGVALVFSDLMMPGMDGVATIRLLRELQPGLRAMLASGVQDSISLERVEAEGIGAFMAKPYTIESLLSTIREVLDQPADPMG